MSLNEAKRLYSQGQQKLATGDLEGAIAQFKQALKFNPNYYPALASLGDKMMVSACFKEAVDYYSRALKIRNNDYRIWLNCGCALNSVGLYDKAIAHYDQALKIKNDWVIWSNRASSLYNLKRFEEALEACDKALTLETKEASIWGNRGNALYELSNYEEAIACYDEALQLKPDDGSVWRSRGKVLLDQGQYQEAVENFDKALKYQPKRACIWLERAVALDKLGRFEEAISDCDMSLRLEPSYLAWFNRGTSLNSMKRYEEAIESFDRALEIESNYKCWENRGNVLHQLGRHEDALKSLDQAIENEPSSSKVWTNRGRILLSWKRYADAITSFQKAIEIDPIYADAWSYQGKTFHDLERYEDALLSCERLLEIQSNSSRAWANHGLILGKLARHEEAIRSCEKALSINADEVLAWSSLGFSFGKLDRYQEAADSYRKVVELEPSDFMSWYNLGRTLHDMKYYEEAIVNYEKALEINPNDWITWNNRGYALIDIGLYEEAISSLEKASDLDPDQSISWEARGRALFKLGRYIEAQEACDHALHVDFNQSSTHFWKALILYKRELFREAFEVCNTALHLNDQNWSAWLQRPWMILRLQGLEAALEAWDEVFHKIQLNSPRSPQLYGDIYRFKGLACYGEGCYQDNPRKLWVKAMSFYQMALKSLEQLELEENCLETLQGLIEVFLGLEQHEKADEMLMRGTDYLQRLLDNTPSSGKRKLLVLNFARFDQLTVDRHVQAASQLKDEEAIKAKLKTALETAEKGKNTCLSWLLYALSEDVDSPSYEEMQQLLSPGTAIAYWHLSPAALTTFVLKPGESTPILISQTPESDRPASLQQLLKLEAWMKEWDDQYRDYRNKGKEQRNVDHSWRKDMTQRLFERQDEPGNLKEILNIEKIEQHLDDINHLVLIPHRDLHRFPLHALFDPRFIASYLPSLKVGLSLKGQQPSHTDYLLSVENPASDRSNPLEFARVESQVISQTFQKVNLIQDAEATQETIMNALNEGCNILHFSGHANHHSENPQKSELLLAGTDGLTLQEICQHDLTGYDLVSLSACETALTNNQSITTEYVGLVSGFLYSGVAQVVSTLWVVESAVSALVMIEFYHHRSCKSDDIALAEAIRWLRSLTHESFKAWYVERLAELSSTLPRERRLRIKRTLDHALARWDKIEQDIQNPYSWAAFTLSGGFF
jgi:tetratricopeptide (TPR) repeat protein